MIPLFKPYMPESAAEAVKLVLYSGRLAFGEYGRKFEQALNDYLHTGNAVVVNSFGSALELLLDMYGVGPGGEVIMSPMGCLRSSQPVVCRGARVVWADIDPCLGVLDPDSVARKITSRTCLIINYHHVGYPGYCDELNRLGREHGVPVVEDCLDGIGGEYRGRKVGTLGDAAVISFDAVRLPNAVEGGAVVFRDGTLAEQARLKRDLGVDRKQYRDENREIYPGCDIAVTGYACTLNEINARIALCQMPELEALFEKRRNNAGTWLKILADFPECRPLSVVAGSQPNDWVFGILTDRKMEMLQKFRELGWEASGVHVPNYHYSVFRNREELPGVEEFYRRFLALPCGWWCEVS